MDKGKVLAKSGHILYEWSHGKLGKDVSSWRAIFVPSCAFGRVWTYFGSMTLAISSLEDYCVALRV